MNRKRLIQKLSLLLLFIISTLAKALPEDNRAILEMQADQAIFDQKKHCGIFLDHVKLDQGSTHIRAFKIITETNIKNQLTKAIITGKNEELAHYWSLMSQDKPVLHAYAERIEYYPNEHLIKLTGHAHIEQGTNTFSAPKIIFNTQTQKVLTKSERNERTLIIFHPESRTSLLPEHQHESAFGSTYP